MKAERQVINLDSTSNEVSAVTYLLYLYNLNTKTPVNQNSHIQVKNLKKIILSFSLSPSTAKLFCPRHRKQILLSTTLFLLLSSGTVMFLIPISLYVVFLLQVFLPLYTLSLFICVHSYELSRLEGQPRTTVLSEALVLY